MEKLIFADDHQELELNTNPGELKDIPFFQGYLSDYFAKGIIHVPNAMAAASFIMEHSTGFKFIYQKLICADYLGVKPDLNVLANVSVSSQEFELLLKLIDYFGYDPILTRAIYQNLPPNYQLSNTLAILFRENYSKCLVHIENRGHHLVYDVDAREYIYDFNEEYLSQYITKIESGREILFVDQNIIILHDFQFICALNLKTNEVMYNIGPVGFYRYELSHDKKFLLAVHAEYIVLYHTNNGQVFKKIMILRDFIRLSHDSKRIVFFRDNICNMMDIESEEIVRKFKLPCTIREMKLSYDDKLLAVLEGTYPYDVRIIELDIGEEIFLTEGVQAYNFSTDSKKILISTPYVIKIYDIYTKELILTLDDYRHIFPSFISPKQIIFRQDGNIYLYDMDQKTKKLIAINDGILRINRIPY